MRWTSALSRASAPETAWAELAPQLSEGLGGEGPTLVFLFATPEMDRGAEVLSHAVAEAWPAATLLGCGAQSVIGGGEEREGGVGLAAVAAHLPGVEARPFHLTPESVPGVGESHRWTDLLRVAPDEHPSLLLLADPFTADSEAVLEGLDEHFPDHPKLGGLASGGSEPGDSLLYCGRSIHRTGLAGVALLGDLALDAVVAQGCRPIGPPFFVTRCRENLIQELDGHRPMDVLNELYAASPPEDQALFRTSLFLGVGMHAAQSHCEAGDFLVRNLLGAEPQSGAIAVAARLHERQVVQFHLRDAAAASADLHARLAGYAARGFDPQGALLFSCLGRGRHLYGEPDHDSAAFRQRVGRVPLGGFFCNGEIGPVGDRTFLHGYTSAFALFRPCG